MEPLGHSIVRGPPAAVGGDFAPVLTYGSAYELLSFGGWPARRSTAPKVGFDGKPERNATTLTPLASSSVTRLCLCCISRSERLGDLPGIPSAPVPNLFAGPTIGTPLRDATSESHRSEPAPNVRRGMIIR